MTTTSRLLLLLSLLQSRRDWPGPVLAGRMEVTDRTVRRDVGRLREMGYRIRASKGPDGGYRLEAGSELPPLLFDDDQAVALAVALRYAATAGAGVEEAAARALTTIRQVMPSRLRHRLDALEFSAMAPSTGGGGNVVDPNILVALSAAVRAREILRFDYRSGDGSDPAEKNSPARRVEPHHIVTSNGRWYLVAWEVERGGWRIFRADHIEPRVPTGPRFSPREVPGGDVHRFVSSRFKGSEPGDVWPCTGTVILHLPARAVLPFVADGMLEDLGGGRCRYTSGAWSWVALAASLGRFDTDVEVEGPPELAEGFQTLAQRFTAATSAERAVP